MLRVDGVPGCRRSPIAFLVLVAGCASTSITVDSRAGQTQDSVVRLVTEAGVEDESTTDIRRLRLTLRVRSLQDTVLVPGCVVRSFRTGDLDVHDFHVDSIVDESAVSLRAVARDPAAAARTTDPIRVLPGEDRLLDIIIEVRQADLDQDELGIAVNSSPQAFSGVRCAPLRSLDRQYAQYYVLQGRLIETPKWFLMAGVAMLALILLTVR